MVSSELKHCPFCGSDNVGCYETYSHYACQCNKCGATMTLRGERYKAVRAWNQRTERTCRNVDDFGDNVGGWRDWETDGFGFTCSECHHVLYPDEMGVSPLAPELLADRVKINYCPNCGARVEGD